MRKYKAQIYMVVEHKKASSLESTTLYTKRKIETVPS